jgi:hypothetical protein
VNRGPKQKLLHAADEPEQILSARRKVAQVAQLSGHLVWDKWQTTAEQLIDTVISLLPAIPATSST